MDGDLPVILGRLDNLETNLRTDLRGLSGRISTLEIAHGQVDTRLNRLDSDMDGLGAKLRQLHDKREPNALGSALGWLEAIAELPAILRVIVGALVLIGTIWGATHVWLVDQMDARTPSGPDPIAYVEHRAHRIRPNGGN